MGNLDLGFYLALGYTLTPLLGLFGSQAGRLLRLIPWDFPVKPNKNDGLIQVMGSTNLAEELYAMFDDKLPLSHDAPITINQSTPPGGIPGTPLTINNGFGGNAIEIDGGSIDIGGDGGITLGDQGSISVGGPGGVVITDGGITVGGNPIGIGGGGGGTNVFLGKVLSGSGDSYEVALYGNGSASVVTDRVTVRILQIAPEEQLPAGTWIGAVHKFITTDGAIYEAQIPIWLS